MDLDHLKKLVLAAHDEETDGPATAALEAYLEELRPVDAAIKKWAEAEARANEAKAALTETHDALAQLRSGRWEIGYVKERVDFVLRRARRVLEP